MMHVGCCLENKGERGGVVRFGEEERGGRMLTESPLPAIRWSILPSIAFTFM